MIAPANDSGGGAPQGCDPKVVLNHCLQLRKSLRELANEMRGLAVELLRFKRAIDDVLQPSTPESSVDVASRLRIIADLVAEDYEVSLVALCGPGRSAKLVEARHLAISISHDLLPTSNYQIGTWWKRDRRSVIWARQHVADLAASYPKFSSRRSKLMQMAREILNNHPADSAA